MRISAAQYRIGLQFLLLRGVLAQPLVFERHNYPVENFSIDLPAKWHEIDAAALVKLSSAATTLLPAGLKVKYDHLFLTSSEPETSAAGLIITLTNGPVSEAALRNLESVKRAAKEAADGLAKSSVSVLQNAQVDTMSYDQGRHALWTTAHTSTPLTGDLRWLSAIYLTRVGTIQLNCYSKVGGDQNYEALCRQILESVLIDTRAAITKPAPIEELVSMPPAQAAAIYKDLVARVRTGDLLVDFRTLRFACVRSNVCDPRGSNEELIAMNQAELKPKVAIAEKLIDRGFVNLEAHATCAKVYADLHQPDLAKFHLDVTTALLRSIFESGDGQTEETAFEVISMREEYSVMSARGLVYDARQVSTRHVTTRGTHWYSRWDVLDPRLNRHVDLFFNIDALPRSK